MRRYAPGWLKSRSKYSPVKRCVFPARPMLDRLSTYPYPFIKTDWKTSLNATGNPPTHWKTPRSDAAARPIAWEASRRPAASFQTAWKPPRSTAGDFPTTWKPSRRAARDFPTTWPASCCAAANLPTCVPFFCHPVSRFSPAYIPPSARSQTLFPANRLG